MNIEYLNAGSRLPHAGPDRVRLCLWYADALDAGKTHYEALEHARSLLRLLHMYVSAGIGHKLGSIVGGIPPEYIGEE